MATEVLMSSDEAEALIERISAARKEDLYSLAQTLKTAKIPQGYCGRTLGTWCHTLSMIPMSIYYEGVFQILRARRSELEPAQYLGMSQPVVVG